MVERFVYLREFEIFRDRRDLVTGAECEHLIDGGRAAGGRSRDRFLTRNEAERRNGHRFQDRANDMNPAFWGERSEQSGDIERDVDGGNDQVETAGEVFERTVAFGVVNEMRAQFFRFLLFTIAGGEGMDFAAPFVGELKREMTQSADADDADTSGRGNVMDQKRCENRDATAEERTGFGGIERIWQGTNPRPLGAETIGKTSVAADDRTLGLVTEIVIARKALGTAQAAEGGPTDANALTDFQTFCVFSKRGHRADRFVARDKWETGHAPFIIEHREIRVADAAVGNVDFDVVAAEFAGIEGIGLERGACGGGGIGFDFRHGGWGWSVEKQVLARF